MVYEIVLDNFSELNDLKLTELKRLASRIDNHAVSNVPSSEIFASNGELTEWFAYDQRYHDTFSKRN